MGDDELLGGGLVEGLDGVALGFGPRRLDELATEDEGIGSECLLVNRGPDRRRVVDIGRP